MNIQIATTPCPHVSVAVTGVGSRLRPTCSRLLASLGVAGFLLVSASAQAQTLGAAQSFAILGGTAVTANGAPSSVNGDVGVAPAAGSAITGFPAPATVTPPFTNRGNDGFSIAARAATLTLYNSLVALGGATPILPTLNGQTLVPGTYSTGAALLTNGAPLVLNGAGTYIFQISSSLTTNVGSSVTLIGANPCNVFWQVTSLATLDGTTFPGTVVAQSGVRLGTGAVLTGRALASAAGDVTLAGGNAVGGCSAAGVGLAAAAVSTVASPTVELGGTIRDTATLTGGGIGAAAPTGTITFTLFGPNNATCAGAAIFTSTVPVNGNGTYISTSFTPLAIGTYRWIANYSGDANNAATANICNAPNESVLVTAVAIPIPTLSEWAMIMLAGLMAFAGFAALRRQGK